ncbi:MAG: rod shape-determining protein [Armatimonadetes bacterium]|nr:MAG: rod shape-determining protein [Armatimonadota bacterium]
MVRLGSQLGIDLGTSNILVYKRGEGIVLEEPTVVALNTDTKQVLAIGDEARAMIGRTPGNIIAIRPLQDGVIAEYTHTYKMLEFIIDKVCGKRRWFGPRVMVCIPSGCTNVERRAVRKATLEAGAKECVLIEEPMAAAIGAGLPISQPGGNMVVDIGGGTTDIAVISLDGIVHSDSIRVGGNRFDDAIARYMRHAYNLMIGERTAEEIKIKIGSAAPLEEELRLEVRGRDLAGGLPRTVEVTSEEIREALESPLRQICERTCMVLEKTPPELSSDIIVRGITLTGGGALLRGLDRLLAEETRIPVRIAENALHCVAIGTGIALETFMDAKSKAGV